MHLNGYYSCAIIGFAKMVHLAAPLFLIRDRDDYQLILVSRSYWETPFLVKKKLCVFLCRWTYPSVYGFRLFYLICLIIIAVSKLHNIEIGLKYGYIIFSCFYIEFGLLVKHKKAAPGNYDRWHLKWCIHHGIIILH